MSALIQLEFFDDSETIMLREIKTIKESTDKVRKGMFARHNELAKMYMDLLNRVEAIERGICHGNKRINSINYR